MGREGEREKKERETGGERHRETDQQFNSNDKVNGYLCPTYFGARKWEAWSSKEPSLNWQSFKATIFVPK